MNKMKGFTIIEMLIVLVLMGILLAVGFNSFGMYAGRNRQNLRDVSTQFYRDYSLIRMDAISQNVPFMIQFADDSASDSFLKYSFSRYNIQTSTWEQYRLDSGRGEKERHCGPFVISSDSTVRFAFDSNGMVVSPDDFNLPQNITFDLEIQRVSGTTSLKDVHSIEIFPSGGIHVTKKLDEEL